MKLSDSLEWLHIHLQFLVHLGLGAAEELDHLIRTIRLIMTDESIVAMIEQKLEEQSKP